MENNIKWQNFLVRNRSNANGWKNVGKKSEENQLWSVSKDRSSGLTDHTNPKTILDFKDVLLEDTGNESIGVHEIMENTKALLSPSDWMNMESQDETELLGCLPRGQLWRDSQWGTLEDYRKFSQWLSFLHWHSLSLTPQSTWTTNPMSGNRVKRISHSYKFQLWNTFEILWGKKTA